MKKLIAVVLAAVMALGVLSMAACSEKPAANADFKVGAILIGDENEGYTYAHIEGIEAAKKACGLSNEQVIYKYSVGENESCYEAAVDLVQQGCKIIFANSFGHESYMIQAAKEYPDVLFCHATGQTAAKQEGMKNIFNYFTGIYEARYVSGIVAGMKLKELMDAGSVTDPYIGYVGAFPYAEVVSGYTAFFLGIQSIVPEAHMDVQYTGKWFDLTAEAEAANMLMARGCCIIGQHADSTGAPTAVQTKLDEGSVVYSVGYNIDMLKVAPTAALTSPQNNWGAYYTYAVKTAMEGKEMKQDWCSGYADDAVQISKLGPSCAAGTEEAVNEAIAKIKSGELHVFDCANFTVGGEHLTSYDRSWGFEGVELIWDGYFHESEKISAPLFDIRIDGITELNAESIG
ncbi:MAG: BMP family ABC transporter substrate-binding protein [Clostridia bacterium]|nr:BMP family ABC transporter substrate-binding protein [Clostridia bacterium]